MAGNYISSYDVKMLAQVSYEDLGFNTDGDYESWLDNDLIPHVESVVDSYCNVPSGFFKAGGLTFTDQLYDYKQALQLRYYPVLEVSAVKRNKAGYGQTPDWEALDSTDYIVDKYTGILYFVSGKVPAVREQSIKVSYKAGYSSTPNVISYVAAQTCANVLNIMLQRKVAPVIRVDDWTVRLVLPAAFTEELKNMLAPYVRRFTEVG